VPLCCWGERSRHATGQTGCRQTDAAIETVQRSDRDVLVPAAPCTIVKLLGEAETEKFGDGGTSRSDGHVVEAGVAMRRWSGCSLPAPRTRSAPCSPSDWSPVGPVQAIQGTVHGEHIPASCQLYPIRRAALPSTDTCCWLPWWCAVSGRGGSRIVEQVYVVSAGVEGLADHDAGLRPSCYLAR